MDPLDEKKARKQAAAVDAAKNCFSQAVDAYYTAHAPGWRSVKRRNFLASLRMYAGPINLLPVSAIDTALVIKSIEPHWAAKPDTMNRVRNRIERVLDWATTRGLREDPIRPGGRAISCLLPPKKKMAQPKHHAALPYAAVPEQWPC